MKRNLWALALAMSMASAAGAGAGDGRGGFLLNMDLDYGGDDLVTLSFEDGDTQNVKAGQGLAFALGGWFRPAENLPLELQGALGYKFVTTAASNADIKVTRTTLQLNAVYRFENDWYLGAGVVRHMGPKLDGDGWFEDIEFDDATGLNVELGWKWVGLHFTSMDYSAAGYEDASAGNVGVRFTWRPGT
jgi:hypothetical protein